jgi:predicted RNase H-like nuclease (RuvC/YqgF family)
MANKAKTTLILLIALIFVSLSLASGVFYLLQKERTKNLSLQGELEEVQTRLRVNETRLDESKKMISALETKLKVAQSQIDTLSVAVEREKSDKLQALSQIDMLRTDLEQQKQQRSDLEKKLSLAQDDLKKLQGQVKELNVKRTELEEKISDLEAKAQSGVELGKIVVGPEASKVPQGQSTAKPSAAAAKKSTVPSPLPAERSLEGKVLVVNRDYDFVVLSIGSKDGVNSGNVFSIYHGNKLIGDVKVDKVHDSMAAASFVSADMKNKVNEGDKAVSKK